MPRLIEVLGPLVPTLFKQRAKREEKEDRLEERQVLAFEKVADAVKTISIYLATIDDRTRVTSADVAEIKNTLAAHDARSQERARNDATIRIPRNKREGQSPA